MLKTFMAAASCGLFLGGFAGAAWADNITVFGYDLNPSLRAQAAPTYEGGKKYTLFPSGSLAVSRPWEFDAYAAPDDAASFGIVNTKNISFGIAASVRVNRGNDDELKGFRNIGWSLEGGGFVNVWPTKWTRFHAEVLKGLTAQSGVEVNTGLDFVGHPGKWSLAAGPRFGWADSGFNTTYFGVNNVEAVTSPYIHAAYTPKAGPRYAGLDANAEYRLFPRWRLTFDVNYHRLLSQDANSPLVKQLGSADQLTAALGVRFALAD